ncbi:TPA: hypothetical protein ACGOV2_000989 [Streptococcus suis]
MAKKLVQNKRDKKNTESSAGFHHTQLESICVFYSLASFAQLLSLAPNLLQIIFKVCRI